MTISDIAKACGCSIATVSRALSGAADEKHAEVSETTRQVIRACAAALNYAPSAAARTLATGQSGLVGVVLDPGPGRPGVEHPFFQHVLAGIRAGAANQDLDLLLFSDRRFEGVKRSSLVSQAQRHCLEGVVVTALDLTDPNGSKVELPDIPCVAIDLDVSSPRAAQVASDNVGGAALATRHLHELGHTRIATVTGPVWAKPARERLRGYREELTRLDIPYQERFVQGGDFFYDSGVSAIGSLLALPDPPTAVFVASDLMAAGVIRGALDAGARVPDDIAIVGFDGLALTEQTAPKISTIQQDPYGLGLIAMQALADLSARPDVPPPVVTLPVKLVVRKSSSGVDPDEQPWAQSHPSLPGALLGESGA